MHATPPALYLLALISTHSLRAQGAVAENTRARDEMARSLIRADAQIDAQDGEGKTAIWLAVHARQASLLGLLLQLGASPSMPDRSGVQPLWVACAQADAESARLLLEAGASANQPDGTGCPPLCVVSQQGESALVSSLVISLHSCIVLCDSRPRVTFLMHKLVHRFCRLAQA